MVIASCFSQDSRLSSSAVFRHTCCRNVRHRRRSHRVSITKAAAKRSVDKKNLPVQMSRLMAPRAEKKTLSSQRAAIPRPRKHFCLYARSMDPFIFKFSIAYRLADILYYNT